VGEGGELPHLHQKEGSGSHARKPTRGLLLHSTAEQQTRGMQTASSVRNRRAGAGGGPNHGQAQRKGGGWAGQQAPPPPTTHTWVHDGHRSSGCGAEARAATTPTISKPSPSTSLQFTNQQPKPIITTTNNEGKGCLSLPNHFGECTALRSC
jgi:hypothetical protein